MKLNDVLSALDESRAEEALRPHWEESTVRPDQRALPFLAPAALRGSREFCGFEPGLDEILLDAAGRINREPALRCLAWHCYRLLYDHPEYPPEQVGRWPELSGALGDDAGVFYLLLALGAVPKISEAHRRLDLPETMTRETFRNIRTRAELYRDNHGGRPGMYIRGLHWLRHYISGVVCPVGRFEYVRQKFTGGVEVYRCRETGRVVALAPDGAWFTADGYRQAGGEDAQGAAGWQSGLRTDGEFVTGFPISPFGRAERREVRLPLSVWEQVFGAGDWTLDLHIPSGGGMRPEACADSLRQAVPFFQSRFPEAPIKAVSSNSWIFNNQLEEILPPSSNLVLFQRELYLFPVSSTGNDGLWFIFQRDEVRPGTAPVRTSLQRIILDFLAAGHRWRGGGMFILVDDLSRFGQQPYRSAAKNQGEPCRP